MSSLDDLKKAILEDSIPTFTDDQLNFWLAQNGGDYRATAYKCLLLKAENTSLVISGLTVADSSKYFRRLAQEYRPNRSGVLAGGF